jgi:hypothetical protein
MGEIKTVSVRIKKILLKPSLVEDSLSASRMSNIPFQQYFFEEDKGGLLALPQCTWRFLY